MTIVLWDIDGTLIRSGGAGKVAMESALRSAFGVKEVFDTVAYSGRTDVAIVGDLLLAHDVPATDENRTKLRDAYLDGLPACLKSAGGEILPGIPAILDRLQRRDDVVQGLLTGNVRRGARVKLDHFGLWDFFGPGGFGDRHTDRNDVAREALAAAMTHLGRPVTGSEIWVIGDTPHDISCARAIGARVLAVATGWHPLAELESCRPDALFADLADTDRAIELFQEG